MSSKHSSAASLTTPVCDEASHAHFRECPELRRIMGTLEEVDEGNTKNYSMAQDRFLAVDHTLDRLRKSVGEITDAKLRDRITDDISLMEDHVRLGVEVFSSKDDKRIAASEQIDVYKVAADRYKRSLDDGFGIEEAAVTEEVPEHNSRV